MFWFTSLSAVLLACINAKGPTTNLAPRDYSFIHSVASSGYYETDTSYMTCGYDVESYVDTSGNKSVSLYDQSGYIRDTAYNLNDIQSNYFYYLYGVGRTYDIANSTMFLFGYRYYTLDGALYVDTITSQPLNLVLSVFDYYCDDFGRDDFYTVNMISDFDASNVVKLGTDNFKSNDVLYSRYGVDEYYVLNHHFLTNIDVNGNYFTGSIPISSVIDTEIYVYTIMYYLDLPSSFGDFLLTPYTSAYDKGFGDGYDIGFDEGYDDAYDAYYDSRYTQGYTDGRYDESQLSNKYTFSNLFGALADTPIMILRSLLGFDVFGVNAMTILMSMVTACIALFVIRKII